MSFNTKTIALSAAALLAVAGGVYVSVSDGQESAYASRPIVGSASTVAEAKATIASDASNGPSSAQANVKVINVTQQPAVENQPASQAPKKLTRQQLTPPPATEEEKLQKAAQDESNF